MNLSVLDLPPTMIERMLTRVSSMKMLKVKLVWSLLLIALLLPLHSFSQSYSGINWYFGGSEYGIRFSRSDGSATLVTNQATAFGTGGSAVASDATNGDLLFYTDGDNIYDRTHTVMPNGTGLGANTSANQAVAIAKVPGQDDQYYVFTNTANGTSQGSISYRIVDMSLPGNAAASTPPAGAGTTAGNTPVAGHAATSEAMLIIPHSNGTDFWLINHAGGSPNYQVTLFTSSGQGTTTNYTGLGLIDFAANFSYHPESGRIAVSPQEGTRDVEILEFDPATGGLTFQQAVLNSGVAATTNAAVYDTEWSANGQYLYISRTGDAGVQADVLQFDLNNPSTTPASILPSTPTIANSYGLQMGPDSTIYHIYQATAGGPFLIGQISDTDSVATLVQYDPQAFGGTPPPNFNGTQFPSFSTGDSDDVTVTFTSQGTCANSPTSFFPTVTPPADSLVWNFGDGSGSSDWSPVHTYEAGGSYNVSVIAYLNGETDTTSLPINITEFDTQISLVQDTTGCSEDFPFPKDKTKTGCTSGCFTVTANVNGTGTPTLQWFGPSGLLAGETTNTLSPDSAGYYYLVATDGSTGCTTYAGVNIKEYLIQDQRANIWYFGNNAGLDFNPLPENPVAPISNPVMNAPEGTATISDRNGQVVFFTDGNTVWDRGNNPIATGIGGSPGSTQSALIMPVAGDETLYYIFTTQEMEAGVYELRYSLFDLKLNGGTGGLVEQNVLLFARSTERITGNGNWLIAHEAGNNTFRAYQITSAGIGNPVISAIGSTHNYSPVQNGQGYMKLGGNGQLAVALSTPGVSNVIEVFDFVDSTGVISNFRTADLNQPNGQVYGVEFSPGGNKLFATLQSPGGVGPSQLVEFAIDSLGNPYLKKPPIAPVAETLGAIQMGPNGQLYVAVEGQPFVGTIQAVEDTTQVSTFTLNGQPLDGGTSTKGLPNFIQTIIDPIQGPGLNVAGVCLGDSTQFTASGKDSSIDKFDWTFGDGQVVIDGGPQQAHLYAAAGTYTVNVRVYNNCESYNLPPQQVTISGPPPDPSAVVLLCTGSAVLDANPTDTPGLTYVWSTGDSTETITVDRQAIYRVTVTNAAGCTTDGNIRAVDNRPVVELGNNITICQNSPMAPLNAQNPGANYAWEVNDVANGNTAQTQSVDTSLPGLFEYKVTVTDPITTCFVVDSVEFTINASPTFTSAAGNTTACGANDGSIDVNITGPANALFSYFITGPTPVPSGTNQSTGPIPTATGLAAGTYGITVADQVSGCATIDTEIINDNAFTITAVTRQTTCDPLVLRVTHTAVLAPMTYRVINSATAQMVASGNATAGSFDVTPGVPSGSYIVELTSAGCVFSSPAQTFNQDAPVAITFNTADICNGNLTAVGNPAASSFDWSASTPGSLVTPGATSATVAINPGQWLVRVTADDGPGGACPGTDSTTVTVDNYTPAFTQSDACEDMVTLTATPAGQYTYRWFRNNTLIPGGQVITETSDNNTYFVQVVSAANGCVKQSPSATVQVDGELTVSLATTTPCEGSDFTLTATPNRSSSFQWALDGGLISSEIGPTLVDNRAGTYTVTASSATCTATADIVIDLAPATPGSLRDEAFICPDPANPDPSTRSVVLYPGSFLSYEWFKDGVPLSVPDPDSTVTATEPGIFSVTLINSFGCPSTDRTEVIQECEPVIVGPNAFRPSSNVAGSGGDMVNQAFKLFTFFIDDEDFQIFIFNRWGEMIFQSPERDFKWNGGYNNNPGELAPPGTYSYLVRYKSVYRPEDGIQEKRGGVVLLR